MLSVLLVVGVLLGFPAPFVFLLRHRFSDRTLEGSFDRISLGYAIAFALLFVSAQFRLWLFVPLWLLAVLACAIDLVRAGKPSAPRAPLGPEGKIVLGAAAIYLVLRCLPFIVRQCPIGWDAYFHMTIVESIVARGRAVHDWLPYEDMPLNYPIGAHLLMALTSWLTDVRPHHFFELIVVLFTLLSGLQLFSLTARASHDRSLACYAALAYLFLANMGSFQYVLWSGQPNLVGMYLFLGLLTALAIDEASRLRSTAVFVCYFLAACFVHHHVMVTAGLCLIWTMLWLWFAGDRPRSLRIGFGLVASGLLGTPYFLMYLLRAVNLGQTDIGDYLEAAADAWGLADFIGLGFSAVTLVGVFLFFKQRERLSPVLVQPLVALLLIYIADEFVLRTLSLTLFRHEIAPFTSSRFITDAVTLLSAFAAICFRSMQGEREANRLPIVALILCGFFFFQRENYRKSFGLEVPLPRLAVYEWIRTHAPADVALIDSDLHATYFTRHMSSSFPLPTSEYATLALNRRMLESVASGRKRPKRLQRTLWSVVDRGARAPAGEMVFEAEGYRVVQSFTPSKP